MASPSIPIYLPPPTDAIAPYDPMLMGDDYLSCLTFDDFPDQHDDGVFLGNGFPTSTTESGGGESFPDTTAAISGVNLFPNNGGNPAYENTNWNMNMYGMKFQPTDEELIRDYLYPALLSPPRDHYARGIIAHANIYDYEPHQLSDLCYDHGDGKMYFYTPIKKIGKSKTDRVIKSKKGCWKATQSPKSIEDDNGNIIGSKLSLTFMERGEIKSHWLMSEYKNNQSQDLVLAVIYYFQRC